MKGKKVDAPRDFDVLVKPRARETRVEGWRDGVLVVRVAEVPEKGKANRALGKALGKWLGVAPSRIEIVSGGGGRRKRVRVRF